MSGLALAECLQLLGEPTDGSAGARPGNDALGRGLANFALRRAETVGGVLSIGGFDGRLEMAHDSPHAASHGLVADTASLVLTDTFYGGLMVGHVRCSCPANFTEGAAS